MLEISETRVYDLRESIISSGNAMRIEPAEFTDEEFERGMIRMMKLCNTKVNSGHQTALCGIRVSFNIKYPNYISPELQRYHFIDIVTSSSKMHRLVNMDMDACFNKYVTEESKTNMKKYISDYNEDKTYENFMIVISNCPLGIELFMRCSTNYQQLKTVYNQRKNHKLKEDWSAVINWIESLPYSKELITNQIF